MRTLPLTIVAVLAVHAAAYAQQISPTVADRAFAGRFMDSFSPGRGPESSDRTVGNANRCGPDVANPVWSGNGRLLGYSCNAEGAN